MAVVTSWTGDAIRSYGRSTLESVTVSSKPPGRIVLRLAGVLTQMICASCLLLGTIAFVLVQQNKTGGVEYVIAWAAAALIGLVFGGLMGRGGMISLIGGTLLDAGFGTVLLALDHAVLKGLVKVLPASDVDMIASILVGAGGAMIAVAVLCLLSIPQALRYAKWLRMAAEEEARAAAAPPTGQFAPATGAHRPRRPSQMTYTLSQHSGLQVRPSPQEGELMPASSTARGWTAHKDQQPKPISVWNLPKASPEEARSRRRLYFALAGFAIGFGAGIGVLVSSAQKSAPPKRVGDKVVMTIDAGAGVVKPTVDATVERTSTSPSPTASPTIDAGVVAATTDAAIPAKPAPNVQMLVQAQRVAIANADPKALVATLSATAIGFGVDADEFAEGRDAIAEQVTRDLGELPSSGFTVDAKFSAIGEMDHHAWIALELEVSAPGKETRRFAITELAAAVDGEWNVVAWEWAIPVADSTAERLAILGTLPKPKSVPNVSTAPKELETAVRKAFSSRGDFAASRSERADGFNFGSAPKERIVGGSNVKRVFNKIRADIKLHDGVRIVSADLWDPTQKKPTVAFAMANVDFTTKTQAATELTQTFRVLAVLIQEQGEWKVVQTQWSHGGPIR